MNDFKNISNNSLLEIINKDINFYDMLNKYGPEGLYLISDKLREIALNECISNKLYFNDINTFNQYMIKEKPKELWLDDFSENVPYITLTYNDGIKFRGQYTSESFLSGDNSDFTWLYKNNIFIKICNEK